jgi:membrane protein YdbS with pleckstrin-like domain
MAQSIQDLLTLAREQLQQGNLTESEESFRRVVTSGQFTAQGLYGIGIVRGRLKDLAGAKYYLLQSLQKDAAYADTHYQLGVIAQQQQLWEEAQGYFRKAVSLDPQHRLAQQALAQMPGGLGPVVPSPMYPGYAPQMPPAPSHSAIGNINYDMPTVAAPPVSSPMHSNQGSQDNPYSMPTVAIPPASSPSTPNSGNAGYQAGYGGLAMSSGGEQQGGGNYAQPQRYGAYDFLRDDPSRRAQNTLAVIDALRIKGHPSVSAYLDSFIPGILGLITVAGFAVTLSLFMAGTLSGIGSIVLLVALGLVALWGLYAILNGLVRYLRIVSTNYTIDQGRFQITRGVFGKSTVTYELLRVHNIEFKQSFGNRLTGDGTLIFHIEGEQQPLVIKGLAKGKKLQETYQQFLNLVSLLRFNPSVKGFIQ